MTKGGENQDSSARDTEVEIAQEEIPEVAASQTETVQIPVTSVPLRRSTIHSVSNWKIPVIKICNTKGRLGKENSLYYFLMY